MDKSVRQRMERLLLYLLIAVIIAIFMFPIYWMVVSSFRDNAALMSYPPSFLPLDGTWDNYLKLFGETKHLIYFRNSVIVAGGTVAIALFISIFAGYAFSRYRFRFKSTLMTAIISVQIFPVTVIMISLFTFYRDLGLLNTFAGLILADIVYSLPFTIWFIKSFFDTVPVTLDESAQIDGCGRLRTMFEIVVPLIKPGMAAIGIYAFLTSWDDFMFGLLIMRSEEMKTLPVGIAQSFMGEYVHDYAGMMTLSVLASMPVVLVFMFMQKYMIAGLTSGAVKG
ncbi:carbohydrate ABC transporter permease [Paenibacillus sp. GCM10027626]|uniref:carbohydrate ABC transporter permease n=1 Tax=Paenibacillus sp. GCM10027626 TaxID=3273411 RepID=UPI003641A997